MDLFYAVADLVVARSGGAVAELTATATPSVLVPGKFGSGGHQMGNAMALSRAGAAVVLGEEEIVESARSGGRSASTRGGPNRGHGRVDPFHRQTRCCTYHRPADDRGRA